MSILDLIQTIAIVGLMMFLLWRRRKMSNELDDSLSNLRSHNQAITKLLETDEGKRLLVDYTLNEAALAGAFDFIFKKKNEGVSNSETAKLLPSKENLASEGVKKKGFWAILLQKLNGILKGVSFGILGGSSEEA
jgi:hypothetical protein